MAVWALALLGGVLIGVSASLAWSGAGRVAGVSGIFGAFLREPSGRGFRPGFLLGLLLGGALLGALAGARLVTELAPRPLVTIVASGLLVGFGTQLARGCTSGHGVCGISRLAPRSLAATFVFMACAALVVLLTRHVLPGVMR